MDPYSPLSAKKCISANFLSLYTIHRKGGKFNAGQEGRRVGSKKYRYTVSNRHAAGKEPLPP
jgi:hypothetical protein